MGWARAMMRGRKIDLSHRHAVRKELLISEVGTQHQDEVGELHGMVAKGKADQARHSDLVGIICLDPFLATKLMDDWHADELGKGQTSPERASTATPRNPVACWIAIRAARGICAGVDPSSHQWLQSTNKRSG